MNIEEQSNIDCAAESGELGELARGFGTHERVAELDFCFFGPSQGAAWMGTIRG